MLKYIGILLSLLWAILIATTWRNFSATDCVNNNIKPVFPPKNDSVKISKTLPDSIFTVVDSTTIINTEKVETIPKVENDGVNNKDFKKLLGTPVEVYFKNNSSHFIESVEYKNFLILAKAYLETNPNQKLKIIGHTDSDGSSRQNKRFALSRAIRMRDNLVKAGFKSSNLKVESKGEVDPLVSNNSEQNKALNRRVSIVLHQ